MFSVCCLGTRKGPTKRKVREKHDNFSLVHFFQLLYGNIIHTSIEMRVESLSVLQLMTTVVLYHLWCPSDTDALSRSSQTEDMSMSSPDKGREGHKLTTQIQDRTHDRKQPQPGTSHTIATSHAPGTKGQREVCVYSVANICELTTICLVINFISCYFVFLSLHPPHAHTASAGVHKYEYVGNKKTGAPTPPQEWVSTTKLNKTIMILYTYGSHHVLYELFTAIAALWQTVGLLVYCSDWVLYCSLSGKTSYQTNQHWHCK